MRLSTRSASRIAATGMAAVLLFLTAFALWTAASTHTASDQVKRSSAAGNAFDRARYAVGAEESLERKYRLEPGPEVRTKFGAAAGSLVTSLSEAGRAGDARDRLTVTQVLAVHRRYLGAITSLFAAVDAGQAKRVLAIDNGRVDPVFSSIEEKVDREAQAHDAEAASRLRALDRSQAHVLIATPIAFSVGLLLLGAFVAILIAYRRRAEEAARAALTRLENAALTDSLTGLRNHRAFQEDIALELKRHERQQTPLTLIMGDVDDLKSVNDALGHQRGDQHLRAVALSLRETARASDASTDSAGTSSRSS